MIETPALKAFTYAGRSYRKCEMVSVPPVVAAALARRGAISLTRNVKVISSEPEPVPSRRRYRRRDLVAEN